ncbi:MAG: DUF1552 domain-containing protein, partial [Myxococcota bacterium]
FQTSFEPLQPWADRTLMLDGLDMRSSTGDAHQGGVALLLSGEPWVPKADNPTKAETGGGISIDRHLARTLAAPTPIDSFNFGARSFGTGVQHVLSYDGPRLPLAPEPDPGRAWDVLFGDFTPPGDPAAEALAAARRGARRRIVDFARGQVAAIRAGLNRDNRERLERHEQALFELQGRIDASFVAPPASCVAPDRSDVGRGGDLERALDIQTDLLIESLSCGRTNVATIHSPGYVDMDMIPGLNYPGDRHSISHVHQKPNRARADDDNRKVTQFYARFVARMLERFGEQTEADGSSMLDHTLILWVTEIAGVDGHSHDGMRWLLFGNVNEYFRMGRHVELGGASHSNLHVSIANAFGLDDTSFGSFSTGTLDGVR